MDALAFPVLGIGGFLAGMVLWAHVTRWMFLLHASVSKQGGDFLGPPRRRLLWAMPFIAFLHPAPWLLCAPLVVGVRHLRANGADGWVWFSAGFYLAVTLMILLVLATIARWKRSRN